MSHRIRKDGGLLEAHGYKIGREILDDLVCLHSCRAFAVLSDENGLRRLCHTAAFALVKERERKQRLAVLHSRRCIISSI